MKSEVVVWHCLLLLADLVWSLVKYKSLVTHVLIQLENSGIVAHSVGVVWR